MRIAILTTGGTFDKVYFDANSEFSIGEPCISSILAEGNVTTEYRVQSILKKDSHEMTQSEIEIIKKAVNDCEEDRILITHGTDTMVETAKFLEGIENKTVILTGSMQPARFKKTDATFNAGFAFAAALNLDSGVYIAMSGRIFKSDNVTKNLNLRKFENKN